MVSCNFDHAALCHVQSGTVSVQVQSFLKFLEYVIAKDVE